MAKETGIQWCKSTMNFWVGCEKVSPACDHCYAESWAKRAGWPDLWQGTRRRTTAANWRKPHGWNTEAAASGERWTVFANSLADFFDAAVDPQWRADAWKMIRETPALTWLILTKRPELIRDMLPPDWGDGYPNVWLGTTAEDQPRADERIPRLARIPAAVRFVSYEPALGPLNLRSIDVDGDHEVLPLGAGWLRRLEPGEQEPPRLDWIIAGGESGPGARPAHPEWFRSLRDQCRDAGVPFFFKQWGEWAPVCAMSEEQVEACYRPAPKMDPEASRKRLVATCVLHNDGHRFDDLGTSGAFGAFSAGSGAMTMMAIGKKAAGRLLDGVEHNEMPR